MSNKDKELGTKSENEGTFSDKSCLNIAEAIEVFERSHYKERCTTEDGNSILANGHAPAFASTRRLKMRHDDYKPGPVKVYTQEEIDEYVQDRSSD